MRTALLAGATGLVGGHCLNELLASSRWESVLAIGRRPVGRCHPKLRDVTTDLRAVAPDLVAGVDDVFCCLGTTIKKAGSRDAFRRVDFDLPMALARATLDAGATRYCLVSSVGAGPRAGTVYLRVKGELEEALGALAFRSLVVLRPSLLLGNRAEPRAGERFAEFALRAMNPLLRRGWRKYRGIEASAVARAMVRLAEQGAEGPRVVESDEIARIAAS
jgi:uncharacterized protein YbjT (DUF2867 family)